MTALEKPNCNICGKNHPEAVVCGSVMPDTEPYYTTSSLQRRKFCYVGAPEIFILERECRLLNEAFSDGHPGCYLVGSALERPDFRDVDIRLILSDDDFNTLFPGAGSHWEQDHRWIIMTTSISLYLSKVSELKIDFQFQPRTHANEKHKGNRNPLGLKFSS